MSKNLILLLTLLSLLFTFFTPSSYAQEPGVCSYLIVNGYSQPRLFTDCPRTDGNTYLTIFASDEFPITSTNAAISYYPTQAGANVDIHLGGVSITTVQPDGESIFINTPGNALLEVEDSAFIIKRGTGGNVVTITAGTGDVDMDIHNNSKVQIESIGGNGIVASSESGNVFADFSNQGRIYSVQDDATGFIATTNGGEISANFDGLYSRILMYPVGNHGGSSDAKGATLTSTSGNIGVLLTNSSAILAPSLGDSHGLEAVTGGDGDINIHLQNGNACIVGRNGAIANTVDGDINIYLSDALIRGRGTGGRALNATSTNGDITITGDGTGNIASVAGNGVYLDTDGEASISNIDIWTQGDGGTTIESVSGLRVVSGNIWANGSGGNTVEAGTVTMSGGDIFTTVHNGNVVVAQAVDISGGGIWMLRGGSSESIFSTAVLLRNEDGQAELTVGGSAIVCGGALSGIICTASDYGYAVRAETPAATYGTTITTEPTGNITGRIGLSNNNDVFYNNGSFTGHGNTRAGDDRVENKGTFTLTGDFEMGEGDDTFENKDSGMVVYGNHSIIAETKPDPPSTQQSSPSRHSASSPSRHSVLDTESSIQLANQYWIPASAGMTEGAGNSRFRLSASDLAPEDTTATINFGGGDDHFINNGTIIIQDTGGFAGLEKITFGENSTVMVTADSAEMTTDKPLIELEGEITAEDVKDLNIKLANPERHSDEFSLFSETALPDNEAGRQAVLSMISGGLGEGSSAGVDSNGNIFVVLANSVHFNYLRNYDAMIQSAYHSDTSFSEKLRGSCYGGEAETQDLRGGCLWADAGSRHTRHDTKVKYGEDAYVFAGGFSIPAGQSAISIGAGYETSDFNAGTDTNASGERFMAGLSVAGEIWKRIIADARTQFAKAAWESTSARGEDAYSAKTNITTWSAAIGAEMPFFPGGVFMVVPRLEAGVARVSADSFTETGDMPLSVEGLSQTYLRVTPSVTAYAPAGESINMWMTAGADAHLTDPKTDLKAAFSPDDPVNTKGGLERINIRYSAGAEVNPLKGISVRVAYSGGVSTTFDTLTQTFTARFGVAF